LRSPRYAGAFVYGRTRSRKKIDGAGRSSSVRQPREQWHTLLLNAHPGYLSREDYEDNLRRLRGNAQAHGGDRRNSPPREGPALLQGLALCGVCGKRMTVRYHVRRALLVPEYLCQQEGIACAEPPCQRIPGAGLDAAIGQLLMEAVTPVALEVALVVQQELQSRWQEADRLRQTQVERARYEANLAQRRYLQVDPDNRLVADALEADWNKKLRALTDAQQQYERQRESDQRVIAADQRARILADNGWMQEAPDPMTKLTWDNAALVSPATARQFQLSTGDLVTLEQGGRAITVPVLVQPGHADGSISLALGYGRTRAGRVGHGAGHNVYPLRSTAGLGFLTGVNLRKTGRRYEFSLTEQHWSMEGRPIVREATLEEYRQEPGFARKEAPQELFSLYKEPSYENGNQWGMAIDLNACIGCNACVLACQAENNIPIVGKDQVQRGREMHWIRLDRYFEGGEEDPHVVCQPMACQQCENAPCENVCPVAPELAAQPAVAPGARAMQFHLVELDLNAVDGVAGKVAVFWKQTQFGEPLLALHEDGQRFAPGRLLAVVDLAQVERLALRHLAGSQAPVLDHAEIAMLLAVLVPPVRFQMHR
jgi:ferredoxin